MSVTAAENASHDEGVNMNKTVFEIKLFVNFISATS
jgi:hypothetical protein